MAKSFLKNKLFLIVLFSGIGIDQISKYFAKVFLEGDMNIPFIGFTYYENSYIAFSIPLPGIVVSLLAFVFLFFVLIKYGDTLFLKSNLTFIALAFVCAGAIGNILDRFMYGYVIDFIKVGSFPVFNIADSLITASGILGILFYKKIFISSSR